MPNQLPYYHTDITTDCPVCGIKVFKHHHDVGTKPRDFVKDEEEVPTTSWEDTQEFWFKIAEEASKQRSGDQMDDMMARAGFIRGILLGIIASERTKAVEQFREEVVKEIEKKLKTLNKNKEINYHQSYNEGKIDGYQDLLFSLTPPPKEETI